jgi:hypothetical protein
MQEKKIELRIARSEFENADEKFWIEFDFSTFYCEQWGWREQKQRTGEHQSWEKKIPTYYTRLGQPAI